MIYSQHDQLYQQKNKTTQRVGKMNSKNMGQFEQGGTNAHDNKENRDYQSYLLKSFSSKYSLNESS